MRQNKIRSRRGSPDETKNKRKNRKIQKSKPPPRPAGGELGEIFVNAGDHTAIWWQEGELPREVSCC